MELLTLTSSFLLALSFLSANCASDQLSLQKSIQKDDRAKITQLWLPRKLNLPEEKAKSSADEDFASCKKLIEHSKGSKQQEKEEKAAMNVAEKGRRKESVEEDHLNKAEYFSMDYGWVKRRRPIHNNQNP